METINKINTEQYKIQEILNEKIDMTMKLDAEIDELSEINEKLVKKLTKMLKTSTKEEYFKIENLTKNIYENNKKIDINFAKMSYLDDEISDLENKIA